MIRIQTLMSKATGVLSKLARLPFAALVLLLACESFAEEPSRHFAYMWGAETPYSAQLNALVDVLARRDFRGVNVRGRSAVKIPSSSTYLRLAFNHLKHNPRTFLAYYHGPLAVSQHQLMLRGEGGKSYSFSKSLDHIYRSSRRDNVTFVFIIDGVGAVDQMSIRSAVEAAVNKHSQAKLAILVNTRDASCQEQSLVTSLADAFSAQSDADQNRNGRLAYAELIRHLSKDPAYENRIALTSSSFPQEAELCRLDQAHLSLEEVLDAQADQVVRFATSHGANQVLTLDPNSKVLGESSGEGLGPLGAYARHRITSRVGQSLPKAALPSRKATLAALREAKIERCNTLEQIGRLNSFPGATAVVVSEYTADLFCLKPSILASGVLVLLRDGKVVERVELKPMKGRLQIDEVAMSGHVNMSPQDVRKKQPEEFAGDLKDWRQSKYGEAPKRSQHPMLDRQLPVGVYLEVDNQRLKHSFSSDGRRMQVKAPRGRPYTIVVENRTDRTLFLRLLVDGRNTLPDTTAESGGAFLPAQYVSLNRARCWVCYANGVYRFRGFVSELDASQPTNVNNAVSRRFVVTDASAVDGGAEHREQLGMITAAFYEAVTKDKSSMSARPNFATQFGAAESSRIELYDGQHGPGPLLGAAPINVRYGY